MCALKSHRYVEIIDNNNSLGFRHIIFRIYLVYFLLILSTAWNLIIYDNGEVRPTDVLVWLPNDFYVMKNVCKRPTITSNYMSMKWYQQIIRFCLHCQCSLCGLLRIPSVLQMQTQLPALAFRSQQLDELTSCSFASMSPSPCSAIFDITKNY